MSERRAFDYALIQIVPRVDRDERLNAGVVLFCPTAAFLGARVALDDARLRALAPDADLPAIAAQLDAVRAVSAGDPAGGPIAALSISERFHWLTAPRSTVVQPSVAHAGLCEDPAAALERLFTSTVAAARSGL